MFGKTSIAPQNEQTLYSPVNPYAAAKVYAHQMAQIYRESYGLYIATGILFNHESERRALSFVTQKIAYGAACAGLGIMNSPDLNERSRPIVENGKLSLGNLDIARDWGYAPDYVNAMWLILQQERAEDFAIGTGTLHTLRELCQFAYQSVNLDWQDFVISDPELMRPTEPGITYADITKANQLLGWRPSLSFQEMVEHMVNSQVKNLQKIIN
jgi:GDPmannose 4,6-dehydratase